MPSPLVKQMLNSWAPQNRIILQDLKDLITVLLEAAPQLQWKTWWRLKKKKTRVIKKNRARGIEISKNKLLSKGHYADLQRQSTSEDHTLALCHIVALNAWDQVEESGRKLSHFLKLYKAQKKPSLIFFFYKD